MERLHFFQTRRVLPFAAGTLCFLWLTIHVQAQAPGTFRGLNRRSEPSHIDSLGQTRSARFLSVSPAQMTFEVPAGSADGDATLEVAGAPRPVPQATVPIRSLEPALFALPDGSAAAYGLRTEPDGSVTGLPPGEVITLDNHPTYLILYATGIGNRSSIGRFT